MDPVRRKGTQLLQQALGASSEGVAEAIEHEIYESHESKVDDSYKESLRTHLFNLKQNDPLRQRVLSGDITPADFAQMSTDDMAGPELRMTEQHLRRQSITDSIFHDHIRPRHRNQDNLDEDKP
ncbi:transcription elongation factor S-II [Zychaea mexicana]|uniref:transcription elongation factor S-II n=1 Tax=Zychaea mexicana TaxID=64656 RepID=UPI0022FE0C11|nr:transcription elongation factor S-II [Zychaea mexicana]KAI9488466.1 transcription elongation factor S-II [Zychaea mexicana]